MKLSHYRHFSSESVSEGHPDKICDQISDAILDAVLEGDPHGRVACEVMITPQKVIIAGEVTADVQVDYESIGRQVLRDIGYTHIALGCDAENIVFEVLIGHQSREIAVGVDNSGAGDQGIMFGYATNETKHFMPLAIAIANELVKKASRMRKTGEFKWARPDMKSEVTVDYTNPQSPKITTILMSIQHDPNYIQKEFKAFISEHIMRKVAKGFGLNTDFAILINPCGAFTIGGPAGDTGLTGRKIIVDTYGGYGRHGGGCFSGKDPSKVDRTAAYMARYVAKNIVASGLADQCEIQLTFAIGVAEPLGIYVDTFGTNKISEAQLLDIIKANFDFSTNGMIEKLDLKCPIYRQTATYGHFGRPHHELPWEQLDKVSILQKFLK